MKQFRYPLVLLALLSSVLIIGPQFRSTTSESAVSPADQKLQEKMAPIDFFEIRRAYPDMTVDLEAYESALYATKMVATRKAAGAAGITSTPWTLEGPTNVGGRINAIAMDPNDSNTMLSGSVSGGIFRTIDGGQSWNPVFDTNNFLSIGELTYQPGSSQIVYAGTGDRNITGFPFVGDGIYKSTDGGQNWASLGLQDTRIISRIIVDPTDVDRIYVGAMGLPMQRNNDRGLYRTTDGGQSWNQVLFIADSAGVNDLVMDPSNPSVLYATIWNRLRSGTKSLVSGPDAGIWKTTDGGDNWTKLAGGLPTQTMSRVSISIDATNPNRLIATYVDPGSYQVFNMYETTNGGQNWSVVPTASLDPNALGGFGWYFSNCYINPFSPNDIYLHGVLLHHSSNNGQSWQVLDFGGLGSPSEPHSDKHDMLFTGPGEFILATDGGLYETTDNGSTWTDVDEIPNSQFYRIMPSPHEFGVYYGGMQDNGTARGNATTIDSWQRVFGGDGFQPLFTDNPNDLVVEFQNGGLYFTTDQGLNWSPFDFGIDFNDRTNWDQPIIVSQHNKDVFYTGTYRLYRSSTGLPNHNWTAISGDLTDGVVISPRYHNITTISESPLDPTVLYTGSSDGNVHVSTNTGAVFNNISAGLPDRYVTSIKASPFQNGEVLVTLSGYKNNSNTPHVFRSTDFGSTWMDVSGDLPPLALNDVLFHPTRDSVWVVASDGGVYATNNYGQDWKRVGSNMPMIPVYDMEWDLSQSKLVAGTFARSIQSFPMDSLVVGLPLATLEPVMSEFKVYPSPASDFTKIEFAGVTGPWQMLDVQGRRILGGMLDGQSKRIDLSGVEAGIYFIRVVTDGQVFTRKLIKK